jgi:ketosteroid isomerase-like protein
MPGPIMDYYSALKRKDFRELMAYACNLSYFRGRGGLWFKAYPGRKLLRPQIIWE